MSEGANRRRYLPVGLLAIILSGCAGPVVMKVGDTELTGRVIDKSTREPTQGALVVVSLARGGFWTTPSTYLMGHALTDQHGKFMVPADPHLVLNANDPSSTPYLLVIRRGYHWHSARKSAGLSNEDIALTRIQDGNLRQDNPCNSEYRYTFNLNDEACRLINNHLNSSLP